MSDYEYISDHESDYSYDDDPYQELIRGSDDKEEDADIRIVPTDPDIVDVSSDESDIEYEEDDAGIKPIEDDEDAPPADPDMIEQEDEDEEIDLKAMSSYNKEIIIVKPEERITSHILSKYEMTEIISIRATEISQYNKCMVAIDGLDDPVKQAKRELMARMCPLILVREVGDKKNHETGEWESFVEHWNPNQMSFAHIYTDI